MLSLSETPGLNSIVTVPFTCVWSTLYGPCCCRNFSLLCAMGIWSSANNAQWKHWPYLYISVMKNLSAKFIEFQSTSIESVCRPHAKVVLEIVGRDFFGRKCSRNCTLPSLLIFSTLLDFGVLWILYLTESKFWFFDKVAMFCIAYWSTALAYSLFGWCKAFFALHRERGEIQKCTIAAVCL